MCDFNSGKNLCSASGVITDASAWQPYRHGNNLVESEEVRIVVFFFITQSGICIAIIESICCNCQENEKCMRDKSLI